MSGRFITIEGGEGAGKSSVIHACLAHLREHGIEVVATREPGGTPLSEQIRALMLDQASSGMVGETELLLAFAARAQHVRELIRPALARGTWVLSDRFTDSSYAYQGGGRGLPVSTIASLEAFAVGDTRPDLTLWLDLPVVDGMARLQGRGDADRIEAESLAFFERVRAAFAHRAQAEPVRIRRIDAAADRDTVAAAARAALDSLIVHHRNTQA
jgi:dTMP kinase